MNFDELRCYIDWLPAELINALREVLSWDIKDEDKAQIVQLILDGWLAD